MNRAKLHDPTNCSCRGTGHDNYPVPVWNSDWNGDECNRCGCAWEIELMGEPNRKQEWCKEVDRLPASCYCHDEHFAETFLAGLDRVDREKEVIVGFINPDGSGEGNWAWASAQSDSDAWVLNNSRWAEKEWARLRADGFSESELRERSGAQ